MRMTLLVMGIDDGDAAAERVGHVDTVGARVKGDCFRANPHGNSGGHFRPSTSITDRLLPM